MSPAFFLGHHVNDRDFQLLPEFVGAYCRSLFGGLRSLSSHDLSGSIFPARVHALREETRARSVAPGEEVDASASIDIAKQVLASCGLVLGTVTDFLAQND